MPERKTISTVAHPPPEENGRVKLLLVDDDPSNLLALQAILEPLREMAGDKTLTFDDAAFDQDVLRSEVPVLVDFWAEWCGPCRQMAPTIDNLAAEYAGKAKVGKLDVDSNGNTAMRYNIRGIPYFGLFKEGKLAKDATGAVGKKGLVAMLDGEGKRE